MNGNVGFAVVTKLQSSKDEKKGSIGLLQLVSSSYTLVLAFSVFLKDITK